MPTSELRRHQVLMVDDNEGERQRMAGQLRATFSHDGAELLAITGVGTVCEAQQRISETSYSLIVNDMQLDSGDGELIKHPRWRKIVRQVLRWGPDEKLNAGGWWTYVFARDSTLNRTTPIITYSGRPEEVLSNPFAQPFTYSQGSDLKLYAKRDIDNALIRLTKGHLVRYQRNRLATEPNNLYEYLPYLEAGLKDPAMLSRVLDRVLLIGGERWRLVHFFPQLCSEARTTKDIENILSAYSAFSDSEKASFLDDMHTILHSAKNIAMDVCPYDGPCLSDPQQRRVLHQELELIQYAAQRYQHKSYATERLAGASLAARQAGNCPDCHHHLQTIILDSLAARGLPFGILLKLAGSFRAVTIERHGLLSDVEQAAGEVLEDADNGIGEMLQAVGQKLPGGAEPGFRTAMALLECRSAKPCAGIESRFFFLPYPLECAVRNMAQNTAQNCSEADPIGVLGVSVCEAPPCLHIYYFDNSLGFHDQQAFRDTLIRQLNSGWPFGFERLAGIVNTAMVHDARLAIGLRSPNGLSVHHVHGELSALPESALNDLSGREELSFGYILEFDPAR